MLRIRLFESTVKGLELASGSRHTLWNGDESPFGFEGARPRFLTPGLFLQPTLFEQLRTAVQPRQESRRQRGWLTRARIHRSLVDT